MSLETVIFIGRSGSGKGTQADLLKKRFHDKDPERQILYIETGEHFRRFIRGQSFSSKLSRKIYESDERQPDFLAGLMWGNILLEELEEEMHVVFDGAPRSLLESEIITSALKFYGRTNPTVIFINVSREWSEKRLLARGRVDDKSLSKINTRLDWFDKDVLPAIEYFRNNPYYRLLEIDGEQSINEVHLEIVSKYEYGN